MSFFDLVRELRDREPDPVRAARAVRSLGWLCILGGVGNAAAALLLPVGRPGPDLPESYPGYALTLLGGIGVLFVLASRGIAAGRDWGARTAQAGIVALLAVSAGFFFGVMPGQFPLASEKGGAGLIFQGVMALVFLQFAVPAYFGFRYLGRLPREDEMLRSGRAPDARFEAPPPPGLAGRRAGPEAGDRYSDSPSPLGLFGTFVALMAAAGAGVFVLVAVAGLDPDVGFPLFFVALFLLPALFNRWPSPFEAGRTLRKSYTGGGSIYLFNGSWPFFRLLVYDDALEVRVMFQRYLVPFDKLGELPEKVGFFSTGLPIESDLPGVPSRIRFAGFGAKGILAEVRAARAAYAGRASRGA